jgi:hypothetical protein
MADEAFSYRIAPRRRVRRGREVIRWALQRGRRRALAGWSPLSPERRWRTVAERLYRTRAAAEKAMAVAIAAEAAWA